MFKHYGEPKNKNAVNDFLFNDFRLWLTKNYSPQVSPSDAVEFANWILKNGWTDFDNSTDENTCEKEWHHVDYESGSDFKTSSELYTLFSEVK